MPCNTTDAGYQYMAYGDDAPNAVLTGADPASPMLFVSNAPEQIGDGTTAPHAPFRSWAFGAGPHNLCRAWVVGAGAPNRVRVFFWHVTRLPAPSYWTLLVGGADGSTGVLSNLRLQVVNAQTGDLSVAGKCLADAHLNGTITPVPGWSQSFGATEVPIFVESAPAAASLVAEQYHLIAAVAEFDVEYTFSASKQLTIRSVVSLVNGSWGLFSTPAAPHTNNWVKEYKLDQEGPIHVRGCWPRSDLRLELKPDLDCKLVQPPPRLLEWSQCANGGPEGGYFCEDDSLAVESTPNGNKGGFGANLEYRLIYKNSAAPGAANGRFRYGLSARDTDAKYWGAARSGALMGSFPTGTYVLGGASQLPKIPEPNPPGIYRGYDLTAHHPGMDPSGWIVSPGAGPQTMAIRIANGGAAGTPTNIWVNREIMWTNPNEPGGGGAD